VVSDATAHLHQAVKASSRRPGTSPAVGIQGDVYQSRPDHIALVVRETERRDYAWSIPVDDNIRFGDQTTQPLVAGELHCGYVTWFAVHGLPHGHEESFGASGHARKTSNE
jgi:hypothetical protein